MKERMNWRMKEGNELIREIMNAFIRERKKREELDYYHLLIGWLIESLLIKEKRKN